MSLDFTGLAQFLLNQALPFLEEHVPGGTLKGNEYEAATIHGGKGQSFKANISTGMWADFAFDHIQGGDLVSLYATKYQVKNSEAAKQLAERYNFRLDVTGGIPTAKERKATNPDIVPPPAGTPEPDFQIPGLTFVAKWLYCTPSGDPFFYVARYHDAEGKKQFRPFGWSKESSKWVRRSPDKPRPLYNLHKVNGAPEHIMVVEGEKAADAAEKLAGQYYTVVTWPNGARSWNSADWSPLSGRKVLVWPDGGEEGIRAGSEIQRHLAMFEGAKEAKIIDVSEKPDGWDLADALEEGQSWDELLTWAKAHVNEFVPEPEPEIEPEPLPVPVEREPAKPKTVAKPVAEPMGYTEDELVPDILTEEDAYSDEKARALASHLGLDTTKGGAPICSESNLVKAISMLDKKNQFVWYDEFHDSYFTMRGTDGHPREWKDNDDLALAMMFQRLFKVPRISEEMARRVVRGYCMESGSRNAPQEWVRSLEWDGNPRVEHFFELYMGCGASEYSRGASKTFWVSMMARLFDPGCKCDTMVILQGPQGIRKSTAMEVIGGPWYVDCNARMGDGKDFFLVLRGHLLVELSELDSFHNAEQTRIKQVLSCRNDNYRVPYGYRTASHPRQCVFVGTTNADKPGKDVTGARRFIYLKCRYIDLDAIKRDREQMFAEAYSLYSKGEKWWDHIPAELANEVAESFREMDVWEETLARLLDGYGSRTKVDQVTSEELFDMLDIPIGRVTMRDSRRLCRCMTGMGWWQKGKGKAASWRRPVGPKDWSKED